MDGMTGIFPAAQGNLADPAFSAWRHVNPYTAATLFSANAIGTGTILDARANGGIDLDGLFVYTISGNNASGDFVVSLDSATWFSLTAFANTAGTTATGQWSGYYPYIAARALWVSAGTRTAYMNVKLALK